MRKVGISQVRKITAAAEMYFDGSTQEVIAQRLGLTRSRISQMQSTPTWQETIARLEAFKQKAQAEAEKRQQLLYSAESDRWFDQSRHMVQVCATTYSKLMLAINAGLDAAKNNPDKLAALDQLKNVPNLIKAALSLQQEAFGRHYDEIEALKILADADKPVCILRGFDCLVSNWNFRIFTVDQFVSFVGAFLWRQWR